MAQPRLPQDLLKEMYIALTIKELWVKLNGRLRSKMAQLDVLVVRDLPQGEYMLMTLPSAHASSSEFPQWIRRTDMPTTVPIAPSTRVIVRIDAVIEGKRVTLITPPTPLLDVVVQSISPGNDAKEEEAIVLNLQRSDAAKNHNPVGFLHATVSFGVPATDRPNDRGSYRPPKDAPTPDLSTVGRQRETTGHSMLKVKHAYSGVLRRIVPPASPPIARLTDIMLARLSRFHWIMNRTKLFADNPADDIVDQLKEFLIFLYHCSTERLKILARDSSDTSRYNCGWYRSFSNIDSRRLIGEIQRVERNEVPIVCTLRLDILKTVYMVASLLDLCMNEHDRMTYTDMITRPWFGVELARRQESLFELRMRTVFFLFQGWWIPGNVLTRPDIVCILLRFIAQEAGQPEAKRPYTTALASAWGMLSQDIQAEVYKQIRRCDKPELRDHYRRALARMAQKAGTLPRCIHVTGVKVAGRLGKGGFADVYRGQYDYQDVVIKSCRAVTSTTPNESRVKKQLFLEIVTWATVRHKRVLDFLGWSEVSDVSQWCMISPFMKGTASERCDRASSSRLPLPHRKRLLKQIAEGMAYLHGENVVHGDLRGPNIFLTETEDVKIADFGLAVYATGVSDNYFSMRTGNTRWTAPELIIKTESIEDSQVREECARLNGDPEDPSRVTIGRPNKSSDVYSFACTCIELIDGRVPYHDHRTDPAVIYWVTVAGGRPPQPRELSTGTPEDKMLWNIIQQCWVPIDSDSRVDRPSFASVYDSLRRIL